MELMQLMVTIGLSRTHGAPTGETKDTSTLSVETPNVESEQWALSQAFLSALDNFHYTLLQVCVWSEAAANGSADNTPAVATTTTAAPSSSDATWCDLTSVFKYWGYDSFTGGPIRMRFWSGSKMYYSTVTCVASKCKGTNGQTNACQYICGKNTCP